MVVDLDEFVYSRLGFHTIPEFLASLSTKAQLVALPWKLFGSSGAIDHPVSAINTFVRRWRRSELIEHATKIEIKSLARRAVLVAPYALDAKKNRSNCGTAPVIGGSCVHIEHQHRADFGTQLHLHLPPFEPGTRSTPAAAKPLAHRARAARPDGKPAGSKIPGGAVRDLRKVTDAAARLAPTNPECPRRLCSVGGARIGRGDGAMGAAHEPLHGQQL